MLQARPGHDRRGVGDAVEPRYPHKLHHAADVNRFSKIVSAALAERALSGVSPRLRQPQPCHSVGMLAVKIFSTVTYAHPNGTHVEAASRS